MLFKNDSKYEITEKDRKYIADFIGCGYEQGKTDKEGQLLPGKFVKFPKNGVVIKFPPTLYKPNPANPKKLDRPTVTTIPCEEIIDGEQGSEKWNYCKRPPMIKPGESPVYYTQGDAYITMSNRFMVKENEIDLLFFLIKISRRSAHFKNVRRPSFQVENLEREARIETQKMEMEVRVMSAILGENKLHPNDISRIAQAMAVPNIEGMTDVEIRHALIKKIKAMEVSDKKNGYSSFMELSEHEDRQELLAMLQKAKDISAIQFDGRSNKWFVYDTETRKRKNEICTLAVNRDKDESLEYFVSMDEKLKITILSAISDAEKVAA